MNERNSVSGQTRGEEMFNAVSHGIGIGLGIAGNRAACQATFGLAR